MIKKKRKLKSSNIIFLIILIIIVLIFIFGRQTEEQVDITEEIEESVGSGLLEIETFPGDAEVFMDNVFRGKSPLTLNNVPVGGHIIIVKKSGYEEFTIEVKIEAGKKIFLEADLDLIPTFEEEPEIVEEKVVEIIEEEEIAKEFEIVNIGNKFLLYYDFSEREFIRNKQLSSDIFSKRYDEYLIFTRSNPVNIKAVEKSIDDVEKEDCTGIKGQFEYLYSNQSLCIITKENQIVVLGGNWETTENINLTWKILS